MDAELKREILLENYQNPYHKEPINNSNYQNVNTKNPNCIDNLDINILFQDGKISDIKFMGEACAISMASTSIMIKNLIGKTIDEAKNYVDNFVKMCNEEEYDAELLNEGLAFSDIYKQNNRKNCALLPYRGIIKAIQDYEREIV